jgi:hypothetical protein
MIINDKNMSLLKPLFGLLQGLATYILIRYLDFSNATTFFAIIIITFPLFALQIKLPSRQNLLFGLGIIMAIALIYGITAYQLIKNITLHPQSYISGLLALQCAYSAFIAFIFYCVMVEEEGFRFPYSTLFTEAWQVVIKLILGTLLVLLTWGLCQLASLLFGLLEITQVHDVVYSEAFFYIMLPFFFGIAMFLLHSQEELMTKMRTILLAFCKFLYPIFAVISLCFFAVVPFAKIHFSDFWQVTLLLSSLSIILFNGVFQAGSKQSPYSRVWTLVIYAALIITTVYSFFIIKFPLLSLHQSGFSADYFLLIIILLILATYNLCYSLAIFFSKKPWLSLVKPANTLIAVVVAALYLVLAQPGVLFY